jgi:glutamate dehydrogenase (NADP+)
LSHYDQCSFLFRLLGYGRSQEPAEKEFHQAVGEVAESLAPVLDRHPEFRKAAILERIVEPERVIMFRVPWVDDRGGSGQSRYAG